MININRNILFEEGLKNNICVIINVNNICVIINANMVQMSLIMRGLSQLGVSLDIAYP